MSFPGDRINSLRRNAAADERGLTLIETMVVVALISILAGLSFPAVSSGLDTLRIRAAADSIAGLLNTAIERAERRQEAFELIISPAQNLLIVRGSTLAAERRLGLPDGVSIAAVLPPMPAAADGSRRFLLAPGATPPRLGVVLVNRRGARRIVSVDPITGVPLIEVPR